uniref:Uncharacterized protein n=1 Tax=Dulem virus 42 TaxID=3145760 RepID=A0AAU8BB04_9CAUD
MVFKYSTLVSSIKVNQITIFSTTKFSCTFLLS